MDAINQFDGNLLIGIQEALNADWLTPIMKGITMLGEDGIFWIVLCLGLVVFKRTRRLGIICSIALLFTFICCNLAIKPLVGRTRPWLVFEEVHAFLEHPGDPSFPSGHSANSMAPAWAMFVSTRQGDAAPCLGWQGAGVSAGKVHIVSIFLVLTACLIGFSRLYLGMHYPTDVIAGLLLGMICATAVHCSVNRYESKYGIIGAEAARNS